MARVLARAFSKEKPQILELGPFCGDTVVHLADQGARVTVEEFVPPAPAAEPEPGQSIDDLVVEPLRLDQPDAHYDVVLAWEHCDFIPPERLAGFGAEISRVLVEGGWLLLFSLLGARGGAPGRGRPARYRLVADDRLQREPILDVTRARWVHPTRDIERALAPLSIKGIHLQRNQMREFLALKTPPKPKKKRKRK